MKLKDLTIILIVATSAVRVAGNLYQPAMPAIAAGIGVSNAAISSTMTIYFLGLAAANIIMGPLSDSFGRRPLILFGLFAVTAGSALCIFANDISLLIAGRLVQAIGTSAIPVTSRAVIRDACPDNKVVTLLGLTGIISALVPLAAPFIGGLIIEWMNWRMTFIISTVCCLLAFIHALSKLEETNHARKPFAISGTLKNYSQMLIDRTFMSAAIPNMIFFGIQGVYLTLGPFIFLNEFKFSPAAFGLTYIPVVSALIIGRAASSPIYRHFSKKNTALIITLISALAGIILVAGHFSPAGNSPASILTAASIFSLAFGLTIPISTKVGIDQFRHVSGAASSMLGILQMAGAAIAGAVGGLLLEYALPSNAFVIPVTFMAVILLFSGASVYLKVPKLRKHD